MPPYPTTVYCEVVVMDTVKFDAVEVELAADIAQAEPGALVVQLSVTGFANPPSGVKTAVVAMERPAMIVPDAGLIAILKSRPFPVNATFKSE